MSEREIELSTDPESGQTLRIVEVGGSYPGFRVQSLEEGILQSRPYWWQLAFKDTLAEAQEEVRLIHLATVELKSLTREHISFGTNRPHTPDGAADYAYKYAEGVVKLNTPGHGYFFLDEERNQTIHEAWRNSAGFYEEDQCWAIVAHHFPNLFTTRDRRAAQWTLVNCMPHEYMAVTGEKLALSDSLRLQEEAFVEATKDKWVSIAAQTAADGMLKITAALGGNRHFRPGPRKERVFLVSAAEYERRPKFGLIIDPDKHREILPERPALATA
ncbi:hypothetical protein [Microvirga sp. VF16]|uniref:DUF7007 domain-containing protein n=1 Tax=Microvirga sp. VF16 TaxID=2807101 RepID=UPI00193E6357|nr:hypothetical protein [Microvirga sp. VF16]QRM35003.1 hypothetical protein JO965_42850 [Microvirga sp. VF16]